MTKKTPGQAAEAVYAAAFENDEWPAGLWDAIAVAAIEAARHTQNNKVFAAIGPDKPYSPPDASERSEQLACEDCDLDGPAMQYPIHGVSTAKCYSCLDKYHAEVAAGHADQSTTIETVPEAEHCEQVSQELFLRPVPERKTIIMRERAAARAECQAEIERLRAALKHIEETQHELWDASDSQALREAMGEEDE